jgi:glycine hydroxymethyltransferase
MRDIQPTVEELLRVQELIRDHENWRSRTLNLIASENVLSPTVRRALDNDLIGRYSDFTGRDLSARRYRGTRYIAEIEQIVDTMARRIFRAEFVELRPLAGHLAGAAVISALCKPGDTVLELGPDGGSHREATKVSTPALMPLDVRFLLFDGWRYNLDLEGTAALINSTQPRMVILGSSNFLFPHPVKEVKALIQQTSQDTLLVYDASHVMGFMASHRFQDPLSEGADVVYGSTHKTFPGPQGGIIYTNREDLIIPISDAIYPALVTNHHSFRMPALAAALAEMEMFGPAYMDQISANAQALGTALQTEGIPCVQVNGCFSQSHTVLVKTGEIGPGAEIAKRLEAADIICTASTLPVEQGTQGLRLGVQEITRLGARLPEIQLAAQLIAKAILQESDPQKLGNQVHEFMSGLGPIGYTWPQSE